MGELRRVGLPDDVRALISRRLARLSPDGLEWLRGAAVIGLEFEVSLLETVLGYDEDRFLEALEEALEAGSSPRRQVSTAAMCSRMRWCARRSTRAPRRRAGYGCIERVGLALEDRAAARVDRRDGVSGATDSEITALAHHFTRAGDSRDPERAITYALAAGEQATAMLAHEEAAEHYARALDVIDRTGSPGGHARAPPRVSCSSSARRDCAAATVSRRGRRSARPRGWRSSSATARHSSAPRSRPLAASSSRPGVVEQELIELLELALEQTAGERSVTRVRLLTRLCVALYFTARRDEMRRLSRGGDGDRRATSPTPRRPRSPPMRGGAPGGVPASSSAAWRTRPWCCAPPGTPATSSWPCRPTVAGAGSDGGGRPARGRGPDRGVRARGRSAAPAAAHLERAHLEGDARAARRPRWPTPSGCPPTRWRPGSGSRDVRPRSTTSCRCSRSAREQARSHELERAMSQTLQETGGRITWRAGAAFRLLELGEPARARAELEALVGPDAPEIPADGEWLGATVLLAEVAAGLCDRVVGDPLRAAGALRRHGARVRGRRGVLGLRRHSASAASRSPAAAVRTRLPTWSERCGRTPPSVRESTSPPRQLELARALGPCERARDLVAAAGRTAVELGLVRVGRLAETLAADVG